MCGEVKVAALFAACFIKFLNPLDSTNLKLASKTSSCFAIVGLLGASAKAKCVQTATTSTKPFAVASSSKLVKSAKSLGITPFRPNPVSTLM